MENKRYEKDADIRLLTLYKQHYLDSYRVPLQCDFSSWGYYDGISVLPPKGNTQRLFEKRTHSPVSELWYGAMEYAENFQGRYSNQSIGIFRNKDNVLKRFWQEYTVYPFFAVAFLQLKDPTKFKEIAAKIEKTGEIGKGKIVIYYTFDSADLVVLMQGNRLNELDNKLWEIETMHDLSYSHSIMGIAEKYLKKCDKEKNGNWNRWNGRNCFVNDKIQQISLRIVTSGDADVEAGLKKDLTESICKGRVFSSHVAGHENLSVEIQNTNVRSLIQLLRPKGFLTHQNPKYGKGLYNIETSITIKKRKWSPCIEGGIKTDKLEEPSDTGALDIEKEKKKSWCEKKIENYKNLLKEENGKKAEKDESLCSYYYALLQTLNTIAQYENFNLASDIFCLIFPAFELFDKQLERAKKKIKRQPSNEKIITENMKEGMRNFLTSVDSIIYHTIHTDQIYLMIPGYTGTVFSIPIKLCLLYQWFIHQIIDLLNDSHRRDNGKPFQYQCLFTPEMESRPITDIISMGLPHGDRLIRVKLSQRSLYMPRDLFIILTHEIAHYVGEDIRYRKVRTDKIICTIATILAYEIVSLDWKESILDRHFQQFQKVMKNLKEYIEQEAVKRIKKSAKGSYYASDIIESLPTVIEGLLLNENREISNIVNEIPQAIFSEEINCLVSKGKAGTNEEAKKVLLKELYKIEEKFEENRKLILLHGVSRDLVYKLSSIYKEVFSDVAAYSILDFDFSTFHEAFCISEGKILDEASEIEQKVREYILMMLQNLPPKNNSHPKKQAGQIAYDPPSDFQNQSSNGSSKEKNTIYNRIRNSLYNYDCTRINLYSYAFFCHQKIKEHLNSKCGKLKEVKDLFEIFTGKGEACCLEIYDKIYEKNCAYKESVNDMLNNSLKPESKKKLPKK